MYGEHSAFESEVRKKLNIDNVQFSLLARAHAYSIYDFIEIFVDSTKLAMETICIIGCYSDKDKKSVIEKFGIPATCKMYRFRIQYKYLLRVSKRSRETLTAHPSLTFFTSSYNQCVKKSYAPRGEKWFKNY
jgi:hypothetical protein